MEDIYTEQLVKKSLTTKDTILKATIIFLTAIIILLSFIFLPVFAMIISLVVVFICKYLLEFFDIEYEYSITNDELDIDIIYAKSRRKKMMTVNIKDFEIMYPLNKEADYINNFRNIEVTKDYSSRKNSENTYVLILNYDDKVTKVIIEPNDSLLKAFARFISPRSFFRHNPV